MIIEGALSVKAALLNDKREVFEVIIDKSKKDRNTNFIKKITLEKDIKLSLMDRSEIEKIAIGKSHGGIIAEVSNRNYQTLKSCFNENPFVAIIEGIEDPFNFGYAIRSLYSAGCSGIIINDRDWSTSEATILKSSAGAFDFINIYKSDDLKEVIDYAKSKGCLCLAAMRKDAVSYFDVDYKGPVLLCVGGEMRGLSKVVLDNVDKNIYIPYGNEFRNALNASSAIAVISYEILRQRLI